MIVLVGFPDEFVVNLNHGGVILLSILSIPKLKRKLGSNYGLILNLSLEG